MLILDFVSLTNPETNSTDSKFPDLRGMSCHGIKYILSITVTNKNGPNIFVEKEALFGALQK